MGTKNDPGDFDCYNAAAPDEPMFVLLARDPVAPILVRLWADMRWMLKHPDLTDDETAQILEAIDCSEHMKEWAIEHGRPQLPHGHGGLTG